MSPYVFAVVGIRIVAVYLATQVLSQALYTYSFLLDGHDGAAEIALRWTPYILSALVGLVIWWLAEPLAARAVRGLKVQASETAWSVEQVQRVALTLIGVWLVVWTIPGIVLQFAAYVREIGDVQQSERMNRTFQDGLIRQGGEFMVGLLLILGASFWSGLLVRVQQFGLKNKQV